MFFETRLNHVGMVNGGIVQHDRNFFAGVEGDDRSQKGQTLHRRTLDRILSKGVRASECALSVLIRMKAVQTLVGFQYSLYTVRNHYRSPKRKHLHSRDQSEFSLSLWTKFGSVIPNLVHFTH